MLHVQQPVLHITSPGLTSDHNSFHQNTLHYTWRGHSSFACGVDTTRRTADTGYKLSLNWRRVLRQGSFSPVGEIFVISLDSYRPP